jgi:hypothetical protein|tara:strand:- start:484 stop:819 length:336 start_codon:yes stop_codon:yes gene_type:complete
MITVGAVHELDFIARYLEGELSFSIEIKGKNLLGKINDNKIKLTYKERKIWEEDIYGEANWFGIESCDRIHKIIECIDGGDESWLTKYAWTQTNSIVEPVPLSSAIEKSDV